MPLAKTLQSRLSATALLSCAHDILDDYINLDISGRPLPARSKGEFT